MGFLGGLGISGWLIVALSIALGLVTWHDRHLAGVIEDQRNALATCEAAKLVQKASIDTYKQAATNQAERTKEANASAEATRKAWAAYKAKGYNDRPTIKPTDSPLVACTGSVKWMKDQFNGLAEKAGD